VQVSIHAAKTNLSKLIEAALAGEDVVIAKGKRPVVRIVPVAARSGFTIGLLSAELSGTAPDFLAPMSDEDASLWEGEA
jgi:prevent-host-death family protein